MKNLKYLVKNEALSRTYILINRNRVAEWRTEITEGQLNDILTGDDLTTEVSVAIRNIGWLWNSVELWPRGKQVQLVVESSVSR